MVNVLGTKKLTKVAPQSTVKVKYFYVSVFSEYVKLLIFTLFYNWFEISRDAETLYVKRSGMAFRCVKHKNFTQRRRGRNAAFLKT